MESVIGRYEAECLRPGPCVDGTLKALSDVGLATTVSVDW